MKLGLFMMPLHPPEKSRTECFHEDIELVELADELGYSEAWVGQHHTLAWEPIPSNDCFVATMIPRTKNIRLAAGVNIMPQHHPANVAVRTAYLDHLAKGRINCGFGQGGVPTDWELFDLPDPKTQGLMTLEAMDMVMKLWTTDPPFDFKGDFWRIRIESINEKLGIGTFLQPYQKPHPPIGMSVVRGGSMAAKTAGQRGFLPISSNLVPPSTVATHWETYCEGAAEAGKPTPDRADWRISKAILVGETDKDAWDLALNGAMGRGFEYLIGLLTQAKMLPLMKTDPDIADSDVTPEYLLKTLCIIGDADSVTRQLNEFSEQTGGFGNLLMITFDWDDKPRWKRSMELLAKEVIPAVK
jgi:alkanesulfonate monooxygenase SsuD/methylene tetrahydromethanopterin reductase-like flavin-dependent oxidoreductase (luciferase family)